MDLRTASLLFQFKLTLLTAAFIIFNTLSAFSEIVMEALMEGNVQLPCDVPPRKPGDRIEFVFWYKDDDVTPLYTIDSRGSTVFDASRHSTHAKNSRFNVNDTPPLLQLYDLAENDSGTYYCRVDFQWSSTRITNLQLKVIVPPEELLIRDENDKVLEGMVGPYKETDNAILTCEARGGDPAPNVTWWRGQKLYDDSFEGSPTGVVNRVTFQNLRRSDLESPLRCEAENTKIAPPVTKTVVVDLHLPPLSVQITNRELNFSAEHWALMVCESAGSRPPAKLTWWLNRTIHLVDAVDSATHNVSRSVLKFYPLRSYNRLSLICRSENRVVYPGKVLEAIRYLNITYVPRVTLKVLKEEVGRTPTEGDYFRMICQVDSNPTAHKLGWLFDDHPIMDDHPRADMSNDNTMVFKRLSRKDRGRYRCYAINEEGKGFSEELELNVTHAPVCRPNQRVTYTTELLTPVIIRCEVLSDPEEVSFRWEFSNTIRKHYNLTHEAEGTVSYATYIPITEQDYGTLYCWANNSIGHQLSSCFFTVVAPECKDDRNKTGNSSSSSTAQSDPKDVWTSGAYAGSISTVSVGLIAAGIGIAIKRYCSKRRRRTVEAEVENALPERQSAGSSSDRSGSIPPLRGQDIYPPESDGASSRSSESRNSRIGLHMYFASDMAQRGRLETRSSYL